MATAKLENWNLATISASLLSRTLPISSYAVSLMQPRLSAGGLSADAAEPKAEWASEAIEEFRHVGKGVGFALAIEGAAALCAYVLWQLWR